MVQISSYDYYDAKLMYKNFTLDNGEDALMIY